MHILNTQQIPVGHHAYIKHTTNRVTSWDAIAPPTSYSSNVSMSAMSAKGDTVAVSGSWKLPLPAPATMVAKNQCLTCCLTCCFWCWISHWVLLILSWNMWLRGRSGGLWLGRDPGGVGGSVKIGDWVFDLVGIFPWLRSFGLTFRLLVLREYSYLGVYLSAVTIWSMPFVLVSCC